MLMPVVPAQVAGVPAIRVVSPRPALETLATAHFLGVREFYRIGGAQAVAALAYGTATVSRVDKIVGPGNLFVTAAKKMVAFDCGIDFLAGPTEVVILGERGDPRFIAADLVAQAEHDPDTLAVFITSSPALAEKVAAEAKLAGANNEIAKGSLKENGAILVAESHEQALEFANRIAVEHITVNSKIAIVAVVGDRMRGTPGIAGRTFSALGRRGINIIAIAQGSSEYNVSFVVEATATREAVAAVHDEFNLHLRSSRFESEESVRGSAWVPQIV